MAILVYKNCKINFTAQGTGKTVVLLHGFLEDLSMWDKITPELIKEYQVISIDLLGHGKTENLGYIHTMEEQAEMVNFILESLKIPEYILIGHSMGGYISLAFAELFPQKIKGVVLMNSSALADPSETKRNRDRAIAAVKHVPDTFVKLAIPNLFSDENKIKFSDQIEKQTQKSLQISQQGIIAALEGMKIRKDRTQILNSTDFSILLIISKKDPALDYQSLIRQSENTPALTHEFPDGHMSHIENKNELIPVLKNFINHAF